LAFVSKLFPLGSQPPKINGSQDFVAEL